MLYIYHIKPDYIILRNGLYVLLGVYLNNVYKKSQKAVTYYL